MLRHATIPNAPGVAILLRHAERPEIPTGTTGTEIDLTKAGRDAARRLGAALGAGLRSVTTSPVIRCRTTAASLCEGARRSLTIAEDCLLGAPGAFVSDGDVAWESWQRWGNEGVIDRLMSSSEVLPGMHPPELAVGRLLGLLSAALEREPGVHVFVTHDAVLAPFAARLRGQPLARDAWPGFLDALLLWRVGPQSWARYRDDTWCLG